MLCQPPLTNVLKSDLFDERVSLCALLVGRLNVFKFMTTLNSELG